MRRFGVGIAALSGVMAVVSSSVGVAQGVAAKEAGTGKWSIAVHGGAGSGEWAHMPDAREAAYHAALDRALKAGAAVLDRNGAPMDAVEAALHVLEDDPLFNAGKGAVFNERGENEMDASIMDGATLRAGAVAGIRTTKNPISLARAVMDKTPYVMMVGKGADEFSVRAGLEQEPPSYFWTAQRWMELEEVLKGSGRPMPPLPAGVTPEMLKAGVDEISPRHKYGTTGVVVRDRAGNVAAGTSTGGLQGKMPGRVGDSPIIGAGTYANNASCAVSGTGVGEYFIRLNLARSICDLVQYKGMTLQAAADEELHHVLPSLKGGEGGVIVIAPGQEPVWSFNTTGMFRARMTQGGVEEIAIRH